MPPGVEVDDLRSGRQGVEVAALAPHQDEVASGGERGARRRPEAAGRGRVAARRFGFLSGLISRSSSMRSPGSGSAVGLDVAGEARAERGIEGGELLVRAPARDQRGRVARRGDQRAAPARPRLRARRPRRGSSPRVARGRSNTAARSRPLLQIHGPLTAGFSSGVTRSMRAFAAGSSRFSFQRSCGARCRRCSRARSPGRSTASARGTRPAPCAGTAGQQRADRADVDHVVGIRVALERAVLDRAHQRVVAAVLDAERRRTSRSRA